MTNIQTYNKKLYVFNKIILDLLKNLIIKKIHFENMLY